MNMSKKFDKRKKVVYDLICDDLYTPMKFKELAMLLRVAKEDRDELRQILESLEQEGKIYLSRDSVLLYWMKMVRQMYLSEKMISVGRSTETMSRLC